MQQLQPVFSVHEFNEAMNHLVSQVGSVVVEGEISQLKISQNKWVFLTLKDEQASVGVFATVWQIRNIHQLEDGMLVKISGSPGIYGKTGSFRLTAQQITPSGEGAIKLAYEKLRAQLEEEGLFDPGRKRPLPRFPQKIGLITAKGSQAYNDFIKVSKHRFGGVNIVFHPVQVQGNDAVKSILLAMKYFHQKEPVDLIVLTRGGGSLEDLMAFNDEAVVRVVFASKYPVVCAIGHEGDISLAELAADVRASTPSNAAELVMPDRNNLEQELNHYLKLINTSLEHSYTTLTERASSMLQMVKTAQREKYEHIQKLLTQTKYSFSNLHYRLDNHNKLTTTQLSKIDNILKTEQQVNKSKLHTIENQLLLLKSTLIKNQTNYKTRLTTGITQLQLLLPHWIGSSTQRIHHLLDLIASYDYQKVLQRGFSISKTSSGKIISSIKDITQSETLITSVSDGTIESLVTKTKS